VVIAKKLSKSFGDKTLFRNTDFLLKYGERLAFIGANGSGKSTFFRMVLGRENADQGTIKLGSSILTGLMEQEIEFNDVEATVLDTFRGTFAMYEGEARNILAKFLFRKDNVYKKISSLSGGEKVRLRICFLMQSNLNFLMLDEPTNHLDIESKEMIEGALQNFKGTILFISHDRYFINKIADTIVALENHKLKRYLGNYDYYRNKTKNKDISRKQKVTPKVKTTGVRKVNPQIIKQLETEIAEKEKAMQILHTEMEFNNSDYVKLMELQHKFDEYQHKLDILLIKWEELLENN
jgi:ATPase subunit of ABC transporter with duplicated ATPase domains